MRVNENISFHTTNQETKTTKTMTNALAIPIGVNISNTPTNTHITYALTPTVNVSSNVQEIPIKPQPPVGMAIPPQNTPSYIKPSLNVPFIQPQYAYPIPQTMPLLQYAPRLPPAKGQTYPFNAVYHGTQNFSNLYGTPFVQPLTLQSQTVVTKRMLKRKLPSDLFPYDNVPKIARIEANATTMVQQIPPTSTSVNTQHRCESDDEEDNTQNPTGQHYAFKQSCRTNGLYKFNCLGSYECPKCNFVQRPFSSHNAQRAELMTREWPESAEEIDDKTFTQLRQYRVICVLCFMKRRKVCILEEKTCRLSFRAKSIRDGFKPGAVKVHGVHQHQPVGNIHAS